MSAIFCISRVWAQDFCNEIKLPKSSIWIQRKWDHTSPIPEFKNTFGIFVKNRLVAAAHYLVFPGELASKGVLTHPEYRFHGYAQKTALSAINHAVANGYEPHYQTIIENFPRLVYPESWVLTNLDILAG
jgi:hypothetical protein